MRSAVLMPLAAAVALIGGGACAGAPASPDRRPEAVVHEPWPLICAPVVGGADVSLEERGPAIALAIGAAPEMAEDVRGKVQQLGAALAAGHDARGGVLRGAQVAVAATPSGAELVLTPPDMNDRPALRSRLGALVEGMRSGGCPPLARRPDAQPKREMPLPVHHH